MQCRLSKQLGPHIGQVWLLYIKKKKTKTTESVDFTHQIRMRSLKSFLLQQLPQSPPCVYANYTSHIITVDKNTTHQAELRDRSFAVMNRTIYISIIAYTSIVALVLSYNRLNYDRCETTSIYPIVNHIQDKHL